MTPVLAAVQAALAVLLVASSVGAQPPPHPRRPAVVTIDPAARDTFSCAWERTIASGEVLSVRLANDEHQADASPAAIIVAGPTGSGPLLSITLAPDTGCGTSGCRLGNDYRVRLRALDSDGNRPVCTLFVRVRQEGM